MADPSTQAPAPHLDQAWLRDLVAELSAIERPSGSPGERQAAEWLVARLAEQGAPARVEVEQIHDTFWWPLGIAGASAALAGLAAARGHRFVGATLGAAAAFAAATDLRPGRRHLRELLPKREASQRRRRARPARRRADRRARRPSRRRPLGARLSAPRSPSSPTRLGLIEANDTSPPLMWPAVAGPAAVCAGSVLGSRTSDPGRARWSRPPSPPGSPTSGSHGVVPGANDNATGVAVLRRRRPGPVRAAGVQPAGAAGLDLGGGPVRGDGGLRASATSQSCATDSTFVLSIDTVGSPHL